MIGRSLGGLFAAQGLYLTAGIGMIWALRTFRTWADALRFLGLAYLLGVAGVGVVATLVLVAGLGVGTPVVVVLSLACFGVGAAIARLRGHGLPRVGGFRRPALTPESLLAGALALLTAAILVAFYRAARHQGLVAWDAWAFWVPKAKAIYFFGGLAKCLGPGWWNGINLWRALTRPPFDLISADILVRFKHFLPITGVAVWLLEIGYPFVIWHRRLRRPWLIAILLMHAGVGIAMGMYLFASVMIVLNLAAFGPGILWHRTQAPDDGSSFSGSMVPSPKN